MEDCPFVSNHIKFEASFLNQFLRFFYRDQFFFTGSLAMLGYLCELGNDLPKIELKELVDYANNRLKKGEHHYEQYIKNFVELSSMKIIRSTIKDIDLGITFENGNQYTHFVERMNAIGYSALDPLFDQKKKSYVLKKTVFVSPPPVLVEGPQALKPSIKIDIINAGECQERAYGEYCEYLIGEQKEMDLKPYDSPRKQILPSLTEMVYQIALSQYPLQTWFIPYIEGVTYGDVMKGIRVFIPDGYDFVLISGNGKVKKTIDVVSPTDHLFLLMTKTIVLDVLQKDLIPVKPEYHMILDRFPVISIRQLIERKLDAIQKQNEMMEMDDRDKIKNLYDFYVLMNTLRIL